MQSCPSIDRTVQARARALTHTRALIRTNRRTVIHQTARFVLVVRYNPGGGKDAVEKYLLLAKDQVVNARDQLKVILKSLGA